MAALSALSAVTESGSSPLDTSWPAMNGTRDCVRDWSVTPKQRSCGGTLRSEHAFAEKVPEASRSPKVERTCSRFSSAAPQLVR